MDGFLLDTHTLIWAINEPSRLGEHALPVLRDRASQLYVSSASAWEIHTKSRIGKLPGADAWLNTLEHQIDRLGAVIIPIAWPHARLAGAMEWEHRDPLPHDRRPGHARVLHARHRRHRLRNAPWPHNALVTSIEPANNDGARLLFSGGGRRRRDR